MYLNPKTALKSLKQHVCLQASGHCHVEPAFFLAQGLGQGYGVERCRVRADYVRLLRWQHNLVAHEMYMLTTNLL